MSYSVSVQHGNSQHNNFYRIKLLSDPKSTRFLFLNFSRALIFGGFEHLLWHFEKFEFTACSKGTFS